MARISTYVKDAGLTSKDLLIGSNYISGDVGAEVYETANFTLGDLTSYLITGSANYIQLVNSGGTLANSVIYQDADGHVGVGVTGAPPNPAHRFEVFDNRSENTSGDYSSVITTIVPSPFDQGAGGLLLRVSTDGGSTYPGQFGLVHGTTANDLVSNIKLAFHVNSDMDTSAPSNLAGTVTHDDTNAHWILNGTLAETTTHTLKVNGTSEFTDDIELQNNGDGIIMKSPDGTAYKVTVANGGTLTVSAV